MPPPPPAAFSAVPVARPSRQRWKRHRIVVRLRGHAHLHPDRRLHLLGVIAPRGSRRCSRIWSARARPTRRCSTTTNGGGWRHSVTTSQPWPRPLSGTPPGRDNPANADSWTVRCRRADSIRQLAHTATCLIGARRGGSGAGSGTSTYRRDASAAGRVQGVGGRHRRAVLVDDQVHGPAQHGRLVVVDGEAQMAADAFQPEPERSAARPATTRPGLWPATRTGCAPTSVPARTGRPTTRCCVAGGRPVPANRTPHAPTRTGHPGRRVRRGWPTGGAGCDRNDRAGRPTTTSISRRRHASTSWSRPGRLPRAPLTPSSLKVPTSSQPRCSTTRRQDSRCTPSDVPSTCSSVDTRT